MMKTTAPGTHLPSITLDAYFSRDDAAEGADRNPQLTFAGLRPGFALWHSFVNRMFAKPISAPAYAILLLSGIALLVVSDGVLDGQLRIALMTVAGLLCLWLPMQLIITGAPMLTRKSQ